MFFLHAGSRMVFVAGVAGHPDAALVTQQASNLALHLEALGLKATHLLRDRDTRFTQPFAIILVSEGIVVVKASVRAPKRNALAERYVLSARKDCRDQLGVFGE